MCLHLNKHIHIFLCIIVKFVCLLNTYTHILYMYIEIITIITIKEKNPIKKISETINTLCKTLSIFITCIEKCQKKKLFNY